MEPVARPRILPGFKILDGKNEDSDAECARYEALIASLGGIDLQLLGLGHNGHIGFNEPAETFAGGVHLANLAERTIEANRRFFPSAEAVRPQIYLREKILFHKIVIALLVRRTKPVIFIKIYRVQEGRSGFFGGCNGKS